ncbi:MAG TPA: JAB domain-containing protein [Burkholderiaceae bacterium]|nr:JAB domain-containing protein [Burkholderiaceae bacterium]
MDFSQLTRKQLEARLLAEASNRPPENRCEDAAAPRTAAAGRRALLQTRLAAARALLLRDEHEEMLGRAMFNSPAAAREHLRLHLAALPHETFVVVFLDAQNRALACEEMFRGTLTQTSVFPREIVRVALEVGAAACLFAHNHPSSGTVEPSRADELLTRNLREALSLVDVRVVDHLVFGGGHFCSFAERGLL